MPETGRSAGTELDLLTPGEQVQHFRVLRLLGAGGMAQVYLARDQQLGRKVALKLLKPGVLGDESAERFLFEARATARFNHPHIVTVYAAGEHRGQLFVALEYLEGESLRERMERGPLGVAEVQRIGLAIAEALAEAHAHGLIHRDLKPENVMLARDGRPRVVDFGLAKSFAAAAEAAAMAEDTRSTQQTLDVTSAIVSLESDRRYLRGTPSYMAPEQWTKGESSGAADVWALGVTLFELLSGARPFVASTPLMLAVEVCGERPAPALAAPVAPELAELVAACLAKNPALRPAAAEVAQRLQHLLAGQGKPLADDENPFRGLLPFDEQHRHLFFGRDAEVEALVERLRAEPLLAVLGPSGAGKSSFVQAGVIPRLRERGALLVLQLRPGKKPFATLAARVVEARRQGSASLAGGGAFRSPTPSLDAAGSVDEDPRQEAERLAEQLRAQPHLLSVTLHRLAERRRCDVLLFVDQLEELYALVDDEATRRAFMQALCAAADDPLLPVRALFTLREEFLSRVAEGPGVREALTSMVVLRPPPAQALREILTRPLQAAGYGYDEPALVDRMVQEVAGELACLPLLQFAGQQMWAGRDVGRRLLLRATHDAIGGVAGALAQHAEETLAGFTVDEVELARRLLLRLVTAEGTRRVQGRAALLEGLPSSADGVLSRLLAARLLSARQVEGSAGTQAEIELAHESLIASWGRLRRWLDESRDDVAFLAEIGQAAELWRRHGQRDDELWTGRALAEAQRAAAQCSTELPSQVQGFLDAAGRKDRRRVQLRRGVVGLVMALLVAIAAVFVVKERQTAEQRDLARAAEQQAQASAAQAQKAEQETRYNLAAVLAEKAWRATYVGESLLYAAGALLQAEHPAARGVIAGTILAPRARLQWQSRRGALCDELAADEARQRLFCAEESRGLIGWDLRTGRELSALDPAATAGRSVKVDPVHALLVSLSRQGRIVVRDLESLRVVSSVMDDRCVDGLLHSTADWRTLACASNNSQVSLHDFPALRSVQHVEGPCPGISASAMSQDGQLFAQACADGRLALWDRRSAASPSIVHYHQAPLAALAFLDGQGLLLGSDEDGALFTLDLQSMAVTTRSQWSPGEHIRHIRPLPGQGAILLGTLDGRVHVVNSRTLAALRAPIEHGAAISSTVVLPARRQLVINGTDGDVRVWDTVTERAVAAVSGPFRGQSTLLATKDGTLLIDASTTSLIRVRRWTDGQQVDHVVCPGTVCSNIVNLVDEDQLLIVAAASMLKRRPGWQVLVGRGPPYTLAPTQDLRLTLPPILQVRPGGDEVLFASADGELCARRLDSPRCTRRITNVEANNFGAYRLSNSGRTVALLRDRRQLELWDVDTAKLKQAIDVASLSKPELQGFSPDDARVLATGSGNQIAVVDLARGSLQLRQSTVARARRAEFARGGAQVVVGGQGEIEILDVDTGAVVDAWNAGDVVFSIQAAADGQTIAVAGLDGTVRMWARDHGSQAGALEGGSGDLGVVYFAEQGRKVCGLDATRGARCLDRVDISLSETAWRSRGAVSISAVAGDGNRALVQTGQDLRMVRLTDGHFDGPVLQLSSNPRYAAAAADGTRWFLCQWDRSTVLEVDGGVVRDVTTARLGQGAGQDCACSAFSGDGRHLAAGAASVTVWDLEQHTPIGEFSGGSCALYGVDLDAHGTRLAAGGCDNVVWVWDVEQQRLMHALRGHKNWISHVKISHAGDLVASVDLGGQLRVWDVERGMLLAQAEGVLTERWPAAPLAFSPDGTTLATIMKDGSIRLWDLASLSADADELYARFVRESGLALQGTEIVADPERLETRFEFLDGRAEAQSRPADVATPGSPAP